MDFSKHALGFRAVFFFSNIVERPDSVFFGLSSKIAEFDLMPTMQPLPPGIESDDFPLVIFRSNSGMFHLEISRKRLDFFIRLENHLQTIDYDTIYKTFTRISTEILNYINTETQTPIYRLGLIADCFVEYPTSSAASMAIQQTIGANIDPELVEVTHRTNRQKKYNNILCNDIQVMNVAQINSNTSSRGGVIFSRDINNAILGNQVQTLDTITLTGLMQTLMGELSLNNYTEAMS